LKEPELAEDRAVVRRSFVRDLQLAQRRLVLIATIAIIQTHRLMSLRGFGR
jgi:hypothetical protein